ncbi:hypothetical protein BD779DRAFT_1510846 [Infundibulicybe gibba]|nr:hypothetical protein BD779DRAFT_1510846 [Infundibulicybe gibba]
MTITPAPRRSLGQEFNLSLLYKCQTVLVDVLLLTSRMETYSVPFSFFCSLLREISQIPKRATSSNQNRSSSFPALEVFRRWISELHNRFSPVPPGTTAIVFRLLFPEEDARRKYHMQETTLAKALGQSLGLDPAHLDKWAADGSSGCLGEELKALLEASYPDMDGGISPLSILQVDHLLDELASHSGFSDISIRMMHSHTQRQPRSTILRALYHTLSPTDASFMTQIILKDLRPLVYPLGELHYTAALKQFNTKAVKILTKEHAMLAWDSSGWMIRAYRVRSSLDAAADGVERPVHDRDRLAPIIGIPVQIPKSEKGRSCGHALSYMTKSTGVWAESKYDGERAQIHVEISSDGSSRITIFSKSKRDSTMDRYAVHSGIRQSLGLSGGTIPKVKQNIILDAEMVAFHNGKIDEFWRIHGLIERTAIGARGNRNSTVLLDDLTTDSCSQASMITDVSDNRQLGLVFFDILLLDSFSLLSTPYSRRRDILESLTITIPGSSMLTSIANHEEGLVLKAEKSGYNEYGSPWVKLKKDYIPGYGDSLDLVIVGAVWEKERARELRVAPDAFTTMYIGALKNKNEIGRNPLARPHIHIYFTTGQFLIKSSNPIPYNAPSMSTGELGYEFTIFPGLKPPSVLFREPLLGELLGAGFTKVPKSKNYELRFPRIAKIYRLSERNWMDGDVTDWCNDLWGKPSSPGVKCPVKRKATVEMWTERLCLLDSQKSKKSSPSTPPPLANRPKAGPSQTVPVLKLLSTNSYEMPLITTNTQPLITENRTQVRRTASTLENISLFSQPATPPRIRDASRSSPANDSHISSCMPNVKATTSTGTRIFNTSTKFDTGSREFFETSLFWFAKPRTTPKMAPDWKKLDAIPHSSRLHTLESLLSGCGWRRNCDAPLSEGPSWIQRGVIFVNESDEANKATKAITLKTLESCETVLEPFTWRKPIWVFDCRTWSFGMQDLQNQAIYYLG